MLLSRPGEIGDQPNQQKTIFPKKNMKKTNQPEVADPSRTRPYILIITDWL